MNLKKLRAYLLLILWMGIIFQFSHQPNSGETTYNVIENILPCIKENSIIEMINFIIRKSAHLTEYFILALLTVSLLKEYTKKQIIIFIITLLFCFSYAVTDEYHQLFIIGRTSSIRDIFIDTTGSIIYLIIHFIYIKIIKNFNTINYHSIK